MRFTLLTMIIAIFGLPALAQAQHDDSILVDGYIISQEFIEAEVVRVSPQERKLTVRGEKRGQTRQFTVPEGTRITVRGREARLRDVRRGDMVLLAMKPQTDEIVISRVQIPETPVSLETRRANPIVAQVTPSVLPKTASAWPTVLAAGLLALFGAGALRTLRQYQ